MMHSDPRPSFRARFLGVLAVTLLAALPGTLPARAETAAYLRLTASQPGQTRPVTVPMNKSMVIDLPYEAAEVIVSQPTIAGAVMRSRSRAVIQGVSVGDTNIFFLDASGRAIAILDVSVSSGGSSVETALQAALDRILPGAHIRVESVALGDESGTSRVVLTGTAQSTEDVAKAVAVAGQFAGSTENVASVITVSGPQQVMIKVTVAEVSRDAVRQFGINLSAGYGTGGLTTGFVNAPTLGGASGAASTGTVTVGVDVGALSIDATLRALERRGFVRTLAEPVLTAMSGQPAEFLAGGEFPIDSRDPITGIVTTTYKDFGARLNFTPTVKSNGVVGLAIETELSEPSGQGALQTRRAKTTVELQAGQTLALGGLLQEQTRHQIDQFPGLGRIPILGALFRSRDYANSQTELVILVTPYLATPTYEQPELPTDNYVEATDAEAIFLGAMESSYGVSDPGRMRGGFDGSVGFVLD